MELTHPSFSILKGDSLRVNPFRMASALFLILSPLMTWITIVSVVVYQGFAVFGTAAQSNLLMVSSRELGTNIPAAAATGALVSLILLISGGAITFRSAKLGVPISLAGLLLYLIQFYPLFGTTTFGYQYTFVSPGIGFFSAAAGIATGAISPLSRDQPVTKLIGALKTKRGMSNFGVFVGVVGLTLDFLNHYALGQALDFVGSDILAQTLHVGLVAGVGGLLAVVALGKRVQREKLLLGISIATLFLLGADATFNVINGTLHDFLGHNLTESVLHLAVYYGVALTLISNFVRKE